MDPLNRREFLGRSALLSAAAAAGPVLTAGESPAAEDRGSAGDRLRVAVVGVNGRGMAHVNGYLGKNNCEIVAVCDCDEAVIGKAMTRISETQKSSPPKYVKDFRKLLDDKSIDVVSIATPNHWHALMAVWAMRAGKDVYCEKPATHNVREGRLMADAAVKYGRVLQVGHQCRSITAHRDAIAYIHDGKIGKVNFAYGTCYKRRQSLGDVGRTQGDQKPPATMDYDLWCGPAAYAPPRRKTKNGTVHYDWHWVWEYGNGDFGNQGVHEVDKARWGLNRAGLPNSVVAVGGRFGYLDDGETPNTQLALYDYGDAHLVFEVRGLASDNPYPFGVEKGRKPGDNFTGNIWAGTEGTVVVVGFSHGVAFDKGGKKVAEFKGGGEQQHFDNFVQAVRSRKVADLHCPIEVGRQSAALCHLANISYRLGAEATMDKAETAFGGNKAAVDTLARMKAHLADNQVGVSEAVGRIGAKLTVDPKTEQFTSANGADLTKANVLLFRDYRKGFDITEAV